MKILWTYIIQILWNARGFVIMKWAFHDWYPFRKQFHHLYGAICLHWGQGSIRCCHPSYLSLNTYHVFYSFTSLKFVGSVIQCVHNILVPNWACNLVNFRWFNAFIREKLHDMLHNLQWNFLLRHDATYQKTRMLRWLECPSFLHNSTINIPSY